MCGIAGIIVSNSNDLKQKDLMSLSSSIKHRGPDGEGLFINKNHKIGLVHRRLSIIDTSEKAHQPMTSPDGKYTLIFNGEIYNFLELKAELTRLGSRFYTDSDTEVIIESWRHWKESMLYKFNGMWSLALLDHENDNIFLSRDRFGIKPLFYAKLQDSFVFASEMKAIISLDWIDKAIDEDIASRMLFDPFGIEGSEFTIHKSIKRLPPGHMAYISNYNEIKIQRWWNTSEHLVSVPDSIHEQVESFKKLFIDAVALRMRSDVSIGACLSGGFDSSAVVCSMDQVAKNSSTHLRQAGNWRNVFVASFPGCSNDESKEALQVARHAKVEPHFFNFQSDNYSVDFNQIINDLDDIYIGIPIAPWMIYAELRKAKCFVSLDGHGADEMMGGYLQKNAKLAFYIKSIISFLSNKSNFISRLVDTIKIVTLNYNKMNFLRNYKLSPPKKIRTPVDKDNYPLKRGLYSNFFYRMFHATTLPTILRNFDRLSMAHGIEIRMPFMDWKLVVFVMSLPDSAKIFSDYNKYIARLAMKNIIPDNIRLEKRKIGFNSPMPELLNGFLGTWVLKQFKNINNEFDKFVDTEELVKEIYFLNLNKAWNWNNAGKLWPYINMKIYMDKYCVN